MGYLLLYLDIIFLGSLGVRCNLFLLFLCLANVLLWGLDIPWILSFCLNGQIEIRGMFLTVYENGIDE